MNTLFPKGSIIFGVASLILICLPALSLSQVDFYVDGNDSYYDRHGVSAYNDRYRNNDLHPGWGLYDDPDYEKNTYGYDNDFNEDYLSDSELYTRIRMNLAMSPFVDREHVRIHVKNGVATLEGTVEDRSAMVDAIEIAYDSGAWKVRNRLTPNQRGDQPWTDMQDVDLKEEIEEELAWSPYVNSDRISVRVKDGVATLYGGVENRGEIADAVENAYEAGAKRVKNRLWIESDHS